PFIAVSAEQVVVANGNVEQVARSDAGGMVIVILRSRSWNLYHVRRELRSEAGRRQGYERRRLHASASEPSLELLVGGESGQGNGRLSVQSCGLRAVVERIRSIARHRTCHHATIVAPVEADPWTALPRRLVLQMGRLVEGFVVVDAEGIAVLTDRHAQSAGLW